MEKHIEIIIVEDEIQICKRFQSLIDIDDNFFLIKATGDAHEALSLTEAYLPDVVILDLELQYGRGSGLEYLNQLKRLNLLRKPYIIVTTNNSSSVTQAYARTLGADFIFYKHQNDYSEKMVLEHLNLMREIIEASRSDFNTDDMSSNASAVFEQRIKHEIVAELEAVGIKAKMKGYKYLIDAIWLLFNDYEDDPLEKIALDFKVSTPSVRKAMEHAIGSAWKSTDYDDLAKHYTAKVDMNKGCPTLMEFMYYYVNKIKDRYGK